jgi:hypothetical protein
MDLHLPLRLASVFQLPLCGVVVGGGIRAADGTLGLMRVV